MRKKIALKTEWAVSINLKQKERAKEREKSPRWTFHFRKHTSLTMSVILERIAKEMRETKERERRKFNSRFIFFISFFLCMKRLKLVF